MLVIGKDVHAKAAKAPKNPVHKDITKSQDLA